MEQDESAEHALQDIILIAEDSDENRRMLYEAGIIPVVLGLWQRNARGRPHLRTLAISALSKMAIGSQENKVHIRSKTRLFLCSLVPSLPSSVIHAPWIEYEPHSFVVFRIGRIPW